MVRKFAKDANAPKRPKNAYFLFMEAERENVLARNPELKSKVGDLSKLMGQMYKALSPEQLNPYADQAAQMKQDYEVKLAEYKQTADHQAYQKAKAEFEASASNETDVVEQPTTKTEKQLKKMLQNKPKRPTSAYMLFMAEQRPQVIEQQPELASKIAEVARIIGARWKVIDDTEKTRFQNAAEILSQEYQEKKAEYEQSDEYKAYLEAKAAAKEAERQTAEKLTVKVTIEPEAPVVAKKTRGRPKKIKSAKKSKKAKKAKAVKKVKKTKKKTKKPKKTTKKTKKAKKKTKKVTKKKTKKNKKAKKTKKKAKTGKKKAKKATQKKGRKKTKKAKKSKKVQKKKAKKGKKAQK